MAADIFFTESEAWSSSSNFFIEIISKVRSYCSKDEQALIDILRNAEDIRCLGINLISEHCIQIALTERVLRAALDELDELKSLEDMNAMTLDSLRNLVSLARSHLMRLGSKV